MTEAANRPSRWKLKLLILRALLIALSVRLFRRRIETAYPAISTKYQIPEDRFDQLVKDVDKLIKVLIFWRRKLCFYRSFCLMYTLRQTGLPVMINFGFYPLQKDSRMHCWLTLKDQLFLEDPETAEDFPTHIGTTTDGQTHYWTSS